MTTTNQEVRILKETTCPSLSGNAILTYQIGCNGTNILFRIHNNSGTGKFNRDWMAESDMLELIYEAKKPFSWKVLYPLVKGKSVNTACFLLAALKNEGLVRPLDRLYEQQSAADFQDQIKKLLSKTTTGATSKTASKTTNKTNKATKTGKEKTS